MDISHGSSNILSQSFCYIKRCHFGACIMPCRFSLCCSVGCETTPQTAQFTGHSSQPRLQYTICSRQILYRPHPSDSLLKIEMICVTYSAAREKPSSKFCISCGLRAHRTKVSKHSGGRNTKARDPPKTSKMLRCSYH